MMINGVEHVAVNVRRNACSDGLLRCGFFDTNAKYSCTYPEGEGAHANCTNPPRIFVPLAVAVRLVKDRLKA